MPRHEEALQADIRQGEKRLTDSDPKIWKAPVFGVFFLKLLLPDRESRSLQDQYTLPFVCFFAVTNETGKVFESLT